MQGKQKPNLQAVESKTDNTPDWPKELRGIKTTLKMALTSLVLLACLMVAFMYQTYEFNKNVIKQNEEMTTAVMNIQGKLGTYTTVNSIFLKVMILRPSINAKIAKDISRSVYKYSRLYEKDPDLILSLIKVESNFNPRAVSIVGAEGLTQVMPFWKEIFKIEDLFGIDNSIKYGMQILSLYQAQYKDLELALTAYNRGPGMVDFSLIKNIDPRNGYASKILKTYKRLKDLDK